VKNLTAAETGGAAGLPPPGKGIRAPSEPSCGSPEGRAGLARQEAPQGGGVLLELQLVLAAMVKDGERDWSARCRIHAGLEAGHHVEVGVGDGVAQKEIVHLDRLVVRFERVAEGEGIAPERGGLVRVELGRLGRRGGRCRC
jgi:hypothetical protein